MVVVGVFKISIFRILLELIYSDFEELGPVNIVGCPQHRLNLDLIFLRVVRRTGKLVKFSLFSPTFWACRLDFQEFCCKLLGLDYALSGQHSLIILPHLLIWKIRESIF
jgi:hypothetical protein